MDKNERAQLERHEFNLKTMVDRAWESNDGSWQRVERLNALKYALASVQREIATAEPALIPLAKTA